MPIWPFKKRVEKLTPPELRTRLIEATLTADSQKLKELCGQNAELIAANLELIATIPDGLSSDPAGLGRLIQSLNQAAECLANEFKAPELRDLLQGRPDTNPLLRCEEWHSRLRERMGNLEHPVLIPEACALIATIQPLQSQAARQKEGQLYSRLGDLLFHSGQMADSETAFRTAMDICREQKDAQGELTALHSLLEVYRHLGNFDEMIRTGDELLQVFHELDQNSDVLKQRIDRLRQGEALCRVVCMRDGVELEVDEITTIAQGRYEFQFRRNRPVLQMTTLLVKQGNAFGSTGKLVEAMEKYQAAIKIDPYDPDPVYQSAVCYLELKEYDKARTTFDEVERLAPGWFRCRGDQWLSRSLVDGTVTEEQFRVLRVLEDGKVAPAQALQALVQMINKYPAFAPYYLVLGEHYQKSNDLKNANACYRKGLELVAEPDLESRLLLAAAVILSKDSPERIEFLTRAISLNGNMVAAATAKLLLIQGQAK